MGLRGRKDRMWRNGTIRTIILWIGKLIQQQSHNLDKASKTEFKRAHQMKRPIHRITGLAIVFNPGLALYFPQGRHRQKYILMVILPPDVFSTETEVS